MIIANLDPAYPELTPATPRPAARTNALPVATRPVEAPVVHALRGCPNDLDAVDGGHGPCICVGGRR